MLGKKRIMEIHRKLFTIFKDSDEVPKPLRAAILLLSNMIFQSTLYMDRTERTVKLGLTLVTGALLSRVLPFSNNRLGKSILVSHFLNFLLNGHLWALVNHRIRPGTVHTSQERFQQWMDRMERIGERSDSIALVAVYGSPARARGQLDANSDLDVRIVRQPGVLNGLVASLIVCRERMIAVTTFFPLDIYLLDDLDLLKRLRDDEEPEVLLDKEGWFS
jgi:predicted nucleotidyltransferase